jgi:hypothetical protein
VEKVRRELVPKIRAAIAAQQAQGDQSVQLLDLESQLDFSNMGQDQRSKILDDGVHLTEYGYSYLGGLIYNGLVKILKI